MQEWAVGAGPWVPGLGDWGTGFWEEGVHLCGWWGDLFGTQTQVGPR